MGMQCYAAFLAVNTVYSWVLRSWPITFPLCFITVTSPLRMYMGSVIHGGGALPWPIYALAYQVYVGMQFTRKIILQSKREMSRMWLAGYVAVAVALLRQLDPALPENRAFAFTFVVASCNYVAAAFIPAARGFIDAQFKTG
jgi:hypothetical protein